jgi:D-alanyl-D-alanine carboxypeptidase/D-alanyl-D-alanine-endopeptidase (penicillin-binding protein 4)
VRVAAAALVVLALAAPPAARLDAQTTAAPSLTADLDRIFDAPIFARALVGVRVESLRTGEVLYERNAGKLVVPASNMKLLTLAAAADRLGWDHRFETRLEALGPITDGVLDGDLIVTGTGDPTIAAQDRQAPALFAEWAAALRAAGIRRITGRLIGDDNAFDDEGLGAGWAWDYLTAGYAAPSGALSYNENVVAVRVRPGAKEGEPVAIELLPPGATFEIANHVRTAAADVNSSVQVDRMPGGRTLTIRGRVPAGGRVVSRTTTIDNPTRFFVEALRLALREHGIPVSRGACDIDDLTDAPPVEGRRLIARRESLPLSALGGHFLKVSQNFYGEMLLKAIGRAAGGPGSAASGRDAVRETLGQWGIERDAFVMYDGSGLSRYDYVTADAIVTLLKHVWHDERLRGPFLAALPIGGHDGTLASRMKKSTLNRRVQAKTGTIANMRALSGFLETDAGEKLVFSIIANHYTGSTADVDRAAEQALERLLSVSR